MSESLFTEVKQWEFSRDGMNFKLPVFYQDAAVIQAVYTGATEKVRALLPHADMQPLELRPGRCLVAIACFEYRRSDIDPYDEVGITFLIKWGKRSIPGLTATMQTLRRDLSAYVWQLPVTTEIARRGGVELYGFPKFIADIGFERSEKRICCTLVHEGEKILSLDGEVLPTEPAKRMTLHTYSMFDGIPLVATIVQNRLQAAETRDRSAKLELGGAHPIAKQLAELALSEHPVAYDYCPSMEAILFAGRNLMDR